MSYFIKHCSCGIKVGDRVRVIREAKDEEDGWKNTWVSNMDFCIGKIYTVIENCDCSGFMLDYKIGFYFPYFVLEKIEEEKVIQNTHSSSCPKCNGQLINRFSEWAGKDIKKCTSCGWC